MNSRVVILLLLALTLGACHSSRRTARGDQSGSTAGPIVTGNTRGSVDRDAAAELIAEARRWLGVPYRYGGNDRRGIDCSGLTCNVYDRTIGVKLPRSSQQQKDFCRRIDRKALQPGDLVFFATRKGGGRVNHVGLYVGGGRMIHASSSRGVMESDFTEGYWADRYYASGRVEAATYASRGTRVPDGDKADKKAKKKKDKKAKKGKKAKDAPQPARDVPTPPAATEVHIDDLPRVLPPAPATPAPATPTAPAPEAPAEEPDTGGGWFD